MRKSTFCICENKDADQLRGDHEADQRLCFRYTDSTIPLLSKSEFSSLQPSSVTVQPGLSVSDQVGNQNVGFLMTRLILFSRPGVLILIYLVPGHFFIFEPRSEKIVLRGFRPGPTQTGLYSHRRWLEA